MHPSISRALVEPEDCCLLLVDHQPGLAFAVQSTDRQALLSNTLALAKTALAFGVPVIASTSATQVYSGPMFPQLREMLEDAPVFERRNMNAWEDDAVRSAIQGSGRRRMLVSGLLTEACVSFPSLSALAAGLEVSIVADTCGGSTHDSHALALTRLGAAGATMTSWLQVLLEFQRDWTRKATYDKARAIVEEHAGGYGMGLKYAREMIAPLAAHKTL